MDPRLTVLVVVPALLLAGCALNPAAEDDFTPTSATRAPVEDVWPRALDLARDWDADARLVYVDDGLYGDLAYGRNADVPRQPFDGRQASWGFTFIEPGGDRSLSITVDANGTLLTRMDVWVGEHVDRERAFYPWFGDAPQPEPAWLNTTRLMEVLADNQTLARYVHQDVTYTSYNLLAAVPRLPGDPSPDDADDAMPDMEGGTMGYEAPRAPMWHVRAEVNHTWLSAQVDPQTWEIVEVHADTPFSIVEPPHWDEPCMNDDDENGSSCGWNDTRYEDAEPVEHPPERYEDRTSGEVPVQGEFSWSFPVEPWEPRQVAVTVEWDALVSDSLRLELYDGAGERVAQRTGQYYVDARAEDGEPGEWTAVVTHEGVPRDVEVTLWATVDYHWR